MNWHLTIDSQLNVPEGNPVSLNESDGTRISLATLDTAIDPLSCLLRKF